MKKYLLFALLGAFACIGFASADTVDGVSSSSVVHCVSFSDVDGVSGEELNYFAGYDGFDSSSPMYSCILTNDTPVYVDVSYLQEYGDPNFLVSSNGACSSNPVGLNDGGWSFFSDSDYLNSKTISGKVCFSNSLMTYSSSSGGSGGGSSSGPILNATGQAYLGNVLSGIQSVVSEFIPYLVYISLGILVVTLGFIAIKRLMNYISRRVTGLFSSRRRK